MEKICFIVCPIGNEGSEQRKKSDKLQKYIIEPVCKKKGYKLIRADQIHNIDKINETIISYLETAQLVIADLTGVNPNVFYEIGYRTALGRPAIQLIYKEHPIPFDLSTVRTIHYDFDIDNVSQIKEEIIQTIETIESSCSEDSENAIPQNSNQNINIQILSHLLDIKKGISKFPILINDNGAGRAKMLTYDTSTGI